MKKAVPPSPLELAEEISAGRWKRSAHLEKINELLLKASAGEIRKLIVNMPPRHGKSEFISKYFPFWRLCKEPDKRVMLCSYNNRFSRSWGRKVKDLVLNFGENYGISLNNNSRSSESFDLQDFAGGMDCAGAGGSITGKGADIIIIDDPVKNEKEALSKNRRDDIWDWFKATVFTRIEPGGAVIIVMTRWHMDDLTGKILSAFNDWSILSLPAIAGEADSLGRKQGEALWEERVSLEMLKDIQATIGIKWFSALYMQNPMATGEAVFALKNFRYFYEDDKHYILLNPSDNIYKKVAKSGYRIVAAVDPAITINDNSDYTAIVVAALGDDGEILILEAVRKRVQMADFERLLVDVNNQYSPAVIGIESSGQQKLLIQRALTLNLPAKPLSANSSKLYRTGPMSVLVENSKVYLRKNAGWMDDFLAELAEFPEGRHDDMVDAFSYIYNLMDYNSKMMPTGAGRRGKSKNYNHRQYRMNY